LNFFFSIQFNQSGINNQNKKETEKQKRGQEQELIFKNIIVFLKNKPRQKWRIKKSALTLEEKKISSYRHYTHQ
jgi:hypothetical protein